MLTRYYVLLQYAIYANPAVMIDQHLLNVKVWLANFCCDAYSLLF